MSSYLLSVKFNDNLEININKIGVKMSSTRNYQLDIMKGIGILFVIWGHISENTSLNNWIYSFHMPLFFFISGVICYMTIEFNSITYMKKRLEVY